MKPFHIRFDGSKALVSVNIQVKGQWFKKTLKAEDERELWQGLLGLLAIDSLPEEQKALAGEYISKALERESIELAMPSWLLKGGKIKVLPPMGGKLNLDKETREEILLDLGLEDAEFQERAYA